MAAAHVTDDTFDQLVIDNDKLVVIDFWAEWCGPCKQMAPALDDLAVELADQVSIVKMNVEDNPRTPTRLNVAGMPTLMIFKNGKVVDTMVGAKPKAKIAEWISMHV